MVLKKVTEVLEAMCAAKRSRRKRGSKIVRAPAFVFGAPRSRGSAGVRKTAYCGDRGTMLESPVGGRGC